MPRILRVEQQTIDATFHQCLEKCIELLAGFPPDIRYGQLVLKTIGGCGFLGVAKADGPDQDRIPGDLFMRCKVSSHNDADRRARRMGNSGSMTVSTFSAMAFMESRPG